jgi:hypothetical protein
MKLWNCEGSAARLLIPLRRPSPFHSLKKTRHILECRSFNRRWLRREMDNLFMLSILLATIVRREELINCN